MRSLTAHRYQFNCRVTSTLYLNFYSGSMLRGAFGKALRKLACVTNMQDCKSCLLYRQCAYPKIFETPVPLHAQYKNLSQIPNPFVIEPPALGNKVFNKGEVFAFNMVLIGQALDHLPLIILAWQKAFKTGLGATQTPVELLNVIFEPLQTVAQIIYSNDKEPQLKPAPVFTPPVLASTDQLKLQFLTPLRIQQKGQILSNAMLGKDFLMALVRRYYFLQEFHSTDYQPPDFKALALQAEHIEARSNFQWCEWQRYSNRQQQSMIFGGVLGELELIGELTPFLPLLVSGQWLHVGNKTTFGMGHYQLL
jgi:CRISPR/Cas system endoribonuclease Cas6 (RAMP superfamily)